MSKHKQERVCLLKDIGQLTEFLAPGNLPGKTSKIILQNWSGEGITGAAKQ